MTVCELQAVSDLGASRRVVEPVHDPSELGGGPNGALAEYSETMGPVVGGSPEAFPMGGYHKRRQAQPDS